jgi:DNA-binding GntR family transcriptional regulator
MVPGEPLGSVAATAGMYGVSRGTARKAYAAMAAEGLIELEPGMGYFVLRQALSVEVDLPADECDAARRDSQVEE